MDSIERLVWGGSVPLAFVLAESDVATLHPPSTRYVLAPRVAYLPQLVESVLAVFQQAVAPSGGPSTQNVWFEACGIPLKWQIPVGVLVDALRAHLAEDFVLPLTVVVHFHNFPSDRLLRYGGQQAARRAYVNVLKQSACLHFGSAKPVLTGLSQAQQDQMWSAIASGDHAKFWSCNDALHGARCPTPAMRRCIRIVTVDNSSVRSPDFQIRAVLCPFEDDRAKKLNNNVASGKVSEADGAASGVESQPNSLEAANILSFLQSSEKSCGNVVEPRIFDKEDTKVFVHGVELPLTASISEIHDRMACADNCLYLIVVRST
eukprot:g1317.t1